MPWADTESGPSNVRDKATSRLFDTRTMSLVSDNTDQSCKLQITGHSSVDGRDKCLKSRETAIADKWNLSRKLACQMDEYATNQELASGVRTRTLVSHCRIVVVLVLALAGLGSPGSEDRKSTRLNSSHQIISYAVFCFK